MPAFPERFLLTGCASGIGRCLTGELGRRGARVLATDVDREALAAAARDDGWPAEGVRSMGLDVRRPAEWARAMEVAGGWLGEVDVLMNVAGVIRPGEVARITDDDVDLHFDVNVKGVVYGTRAAAAAMIPRGRGHVVNVASMAALAPIPGIALYSASKYAVRAFSLAAAEELRPHGVAVTAVCPDAVATPMLDRQLPHPEAALTFTAPRVLAVEEVSRLLLGRVLRRRPLLVAVPRRRALLARLADLFPDLTRLLAPRLRRQGLERQAELRRQRSGDA